MKFYSATSDAKHNHISVSYDEHAFHAKMLLNSILRKLNNRYSSINRLPAIDDLVNENMMPYIRYDSKTTSNVMIS